MTVPIPFDVACWLRSFHFRCTLDTIRAAASMLVRACVFAHINGFRAVVTGWTRTAPLH
ncbi:hypothetical protein I546_1153 [Mycobacterium kansasii 732]|nr:hypothetical protein I546_1153 [Mycobacterium kansasii 732]